MLRTHCTIVCVALAVPALAQSPSSQPSLKPLDIGERRQVFIDGRFFAASKGVQLTVHEPVKTGEQTIKPDRPWEKPIGAYASVLEEKGTYHMWYKPGDAICYARSRDGIHWEKPALGVVEYAGSRDNNIVVGLGAAGGEDAGHGPQVFIDPNAPPEQRFRLLTRQSDPGNFANLFSSPDGIHWKLTHPNILKYHPLVKPFHLDSQNVIFWDERIGKYVAYMRRNIRARGSQGRSVVRSESPTLDGFAEVQDAQVVLTHDDNDPVLGKTDVVDYYTNSAIKYPWAEDAYYMFPTTYFHYVVGELGEFREEAPVNAGPLDTQFAASRDGVTWQRYQRRPFVRLGYRGSFDSMGARVFYGLVPSVDGRDMYMYYVGTDHNHGWGRDEKNNRLLTNAGLKPVLDTSIISRLVLRRDGFTSMRADYWPGGWFETQPLIFTGRRLVLNVDTSATGTARVEILDADGKSIDGYSADQCDLIHTCNEINRVVKWRSSDDLTRLAGRPVRLRFVMRDCDLYAMQFQP